MRGRWTWIWSTAALTSALAPSPADAQPAGQSAVVAIGQCSVAGSAIAARSFRTALTQRLGASVQPEVQTAAPLGGLAERTLPELLAALNTARNDFYGDKTEVALSSVKGALDDVVRLVPSAARWSAESELLTFQAQVELKTDRATAEATLSRVFYVDPDYKPDTSVFPPSFQRFADEVRKAVKKLPTNRLDIAVAPPGKPVFVGGKPVGDAPLSLRLPAGDYRVEVGWGYRGLSRTVTVLAPPELAKPVELAAAVEGAVAPDGGPCVEPVPDMATALGRLLPLLKVSQVYGVRTLIWGTDRYASVTEVSGGGNQLRTVRVKLQPGAPESDALALMAGFFQAGQGGPLVEVLPKGATDVPPTVAAAAGTGKTTSPAAQSKGSPGLQIAGWVVGGVGVLGIGVGVAAFISANNAKNSLSAKQVNGAFPPNYQSQFQSANNTIQSRQTLAVIAGSVGVAALVTGVVLIVVGSSHSSPSVSVSPSLIPGGGGALVAGSF
ncbi:MAG: PEGA domain-containing protein [Myxococcaceae bacterium]